MTPISALTRLTSLAPTPRPAGRGAPERVVADRSRFDARAAGRSADRLLADGRPGVPLYGAAAYLGVARALADRPAPDARLELSARVLADGERVSVARRLEGARTVGIEAVVG